MRYPLFVDGAFEVEHATAATEQTFNLYPVTLKRGSKSPIILLPSPGVTSYATAANSKTNFRALFQNSARMFAVVEDQFQEIPLGGGAMTDRMSALPDFAINTGGATISSNGEGGGELFVTIGGANQKGYLFTLATSTLSEVLASGVTMGAAIDGYFLNLDTTNAQLAISDLNDGTTWDPLQVVARSKADDPWTAVIVQGADIYLVGNRTSEVWYNAGTSPFPFALQSPLIPFGTPSRYSVKKVAGSVLWLAQSEDGFLGVIQATGTHPRIVSDEGVEHALRTYQEADTLALAEAATYSYRGHPMYMLTFPDSDHNATWVYDLVEQKWHRRGIWDSGDSEYDAWDPLHHAVDQFGRHVVGSRTTGTAYRMSHTIHTDTDGNGIRRARRAPVLSMENRRLRFTRLELDLQVGLGNASPPGDDPEVTLNYSDDGGISWKSAGTKKAGQASEDTKRVFWNQLGSSRNRVFEVVMDDPIPWRITDAYVEIN